MMRLKSISSCFLSFPIFLIMRTWIVQYRFCCCSFSKDVSKVFKFSCRIWICFSYFNFSISRSVFNCLIFWLSSSTMASSKLNQSISESRNTICGNDQFCYYDLQLRTLLVLNWYYLGVFVNFVEWREQLMKWSKKKLRLQLKREFLVQ